MGKEQRQPNVVEMILAKQKKREEEERARQQAIMEERKKAQELARKVDEELRKRNELFQGLDRKHGISASIQRINEEILERKGEVYINLPCKRLAVEFVDFYDHERRLNSLLKPVEGEKMRISLVWGTYSMPGRAGGNAISIEILRDSVRVKGEGMQEASSISFSDLKFANEYQKALAEAFENSRWSKPAPHEWWLHRRFT